MPRRVAGVPPAGRLAREAARRLLDEWSCSTGQHLFGATRIDVHAVCRHFGLTVEQDSEFGSTAELWSPFSLNHGHDSIHVKPGLEWNTRRYTLAHEVGHWYLQERRPAALSKEDEEAFCNEFAGELLVPREVLLEWTRRAELAGERISLETVLEGARRAGVGHFVFVRRLMLSAIAQKLDARALIFVARPGVARTTRAQMALRVESVSPPSSLFIPTNRRLVSIGLGSVQRSFEEMKHLERRTYVGYLEAKNRWRSSRPVQVTCEVSYMKFGKAQGREYLVAAGRCGWPGRTSE